MYSQPLIHRWPGLQWEYWNTQVPVGSNGVQMLENTVVKSPSSICWNLNLSVACQPNIVWLSACLGNSQRLTEPRALIGFAPPIYPQLGRPDFAACKIQWKHIAQCLNLASHFASSKTLIFNKGFACTNVHWNLYILFIEIQYVLHCILPYAEHVQHLKSPLIHLLMTWYHPLRCI